MKIKNLLKKHQPNKQSTQPKPCRVLNIQTKYGNVEIVNLKRIWINEWFGTHRLMYSDDNYEYNCIYWTDSPNHNYQSYKNKIIEAYNNGDSFIEI